MATHMKGKWKKFQIRRWTDKDGDHEYVVWGKPRGWFKSWRGPLGSFDTMTAAEAYIRSEADRPYVSTWWDYDAHGRSTEYLNW